MARVVPRREKKMLRTGLRMDRWEDQVSPSSEVMALSFGGEARGGRRQTVVKGIGLGIFWTYDEACGAEDDC